MYELSHYHFVDFKDKIKDIDIEFPSNYNYHNGIVHAQMDCQVVDVLVEDGALVEKGTPLLVLDAEAPSIVSPYFPMSEQKKTEIKRILKGRPRVGISLKDFLVQQNVVGNGNVPLGSLANVDVMKMYENFKKFQIVGDHSDHLFFLDFKGWKQGLRPAVSNLNGAPDLAHPPEDWANKIREEWAILEEHLPDTIYVRVYKARMDILRALIIGQKGTPYHDGLFFFDVRFPSKYPEIPPLVRYRSGDPDYNPELDKSGELGWHLLNTRGWWVPGTSNMLQLLVSIQDLIMNSKPFYNGFGNAQMMGDVVGDRFSLLFNEMTVINSLITMVYTMNKPPKNFEGFVVAHFRKHALEILNACRAYIKGLQGGCLVSGNNHSCSIGFKNDVASCVKPLLKAFKTIGANEACLSEKESPLNDIDTSRVRPLLTIAAPIDCRVSKVMVSAGDKIEKGKPLYVFGEGKTKERSRTCPTGSRIQKAVIMSILKGNRVAGVGIFSTEEVSVGAQNNLMAEVDVEKAQKSFDHVEDDSDHFFLGESYVVNTRSEDWVKKIHEEWKILEEMLPETIKVKVYKSRMDLLRAVIIGKEGTPYHDGLFFFDVCFPSNYPNCPPLVHYHSGGLSINPNLSKDGKVHLSFPKTSDGQVTMWVPGLSNILHLLVSIQNLILNKQPLFNESAYAYMRGSAYGKVSSELYNELMYTKTLKTMAVIMSKPPKNFVDFVVLHFRKRACDIMMTCTKKLDVATSVSYKKYLSSSINLLVFTLRKIGAEYGIQEFLQASCLQLSMMKL